MKDENGNQIPDKLIDQATQETQEEYLDVEKRFVEAGQELLDRFNIDLDDLKDILNDQLNEEF